MTPKFLIAGMSSLCAVPTIGAIAFTTQSVVEELNKVKVIVDTDVGNDCDDIGALSILGNAYNKGMVRIEAVTVSNRYIPSVNTTDIMLEEYGIDCPLGMSDTEQEVHLWHDYAKAVDDIWTARCEKDKSRVQSATLVLRKALAKAERQGYKIKLITLGMLNNIANLLASPGDNISPKTGRQLFEDNVSEMVLMGGRFNDDQYREFNIIENIEAAKAVINEPSSVPKTFCGWEVGGDVFSGSTFYANPNTPQEVAYQTYNEGNPRESWDPITMFVALNGAWEYSKMGNVTVVADSQGNEGVTKFVESEKGIDRYVQIHPNKEQLVDQLEKWYKIGNVALEQ